LLFATVLFQALRLERRIDRLERTEASARAPAAESRPPFPGSSAVAPLVNTDARVATPENGQAAAPSGFLLGYDSFRAVWQQGPGREAERCWTSAAPAGSGPAPVANLFHFSLTVDPQGAVTALQPERTRAGINGAQRDPRSDAVQDCLANLIKGMHFPASGSAQSARIQVDRAQR
jgi:hypothetical protein